MLARGRAFRPMLRVYVSAQILGRMENEGLSARSWVPSSRDSLANGNFNCFGGELWPLRKLRYSNSGEFLRERVFQNKFSMVGVFCLH
jgi:hypothetical protein